MIGKWSTFWSSLPGSYKKSFYAGVGAYAALTLVIGGLAFVNAPQTVEDWHNRFPQAEAKIKKVFLAPALTETSDTTFEAISDPSFEKADMALTETPSIAIVMTDMGLSKYATERAIDDLPEQIALAFSPYATVLQETLTRAKEEGKETLILAPMEPDTFPQDDPGPDALLSRLSEQENIERLEKITAKAKGAVGVMNFMGSLFLTDPENMESVFKPLRAAGLFFLEMPYTKRSRAQQVALEHGVPYATIDMQIDTETEEHIIRQKLLELETLARTQGFAIGVARPLPITFTTLKAWIETLEKRNIQLVPLSSLVQRKPRHEKTEPGPEQQQNPETGHTEGQQH